MRGAGASRGVRALLQQSSTEPGLLAERLASSSLASASSSTASAASTVSRAEAQLLHSLVRHFRAAAGRSGMRSTPGFGKLLGLQLQEVKVSCLAHSPVQAHHLGMCSSSLLDLCDACRRRLHLVRACGVLMALNNRARVCVDPSCACCELLQSSGSACEADNLSTGRL